MKTRVVVAVIVLVAVVALVAVLSSRRPEPGRTEGPPVTAAGEDSEIVPAVAEAGQVSYREATLDAIKTGADYLKNHQNEDGSWGKYPSVGITSLVLHAMFVSPLGLTAGNTPEIRKGLEYIAARAQPSGEINDKGGGLPNYNTTLAILALSASGDPAYEPLIKNGQEFIKGLQFAENQGVGVDNPIYGGIGYGSHKERPDMSNTQWAVEALRETGVSEDDQAFKKAMFFLHRCQNSPEVSDMPYAAVVNDGGGLYTSQAGAEDISKAGRLTVRGKVGWRSYGSMTYAMLKSYVYIGLKKDSPEVRGALDWISNNWTVTENPGMGNAMQGYYYYIATFSKTFSVMDEPVVKDAGGREHRWADELIVQLLKIRNEDGSWVNQADRWYEGDPTLVTAYVVRSLSYASKFASDAPVPEE